MIKRFIATLMLVAILAAACGSDEGSHDDHSGAAGGASGASGSVPGGPAPRSDADRKVSIVTTDELRFEPSSVEVSAGEVVTFVIRNTGGSPHEFVLGDEAYQEGHAHGGHGEMSENAVEIAPGASASLTWRFDEQGEVLYGCHVAGHYDAGMVGTIDVT